MTDALVIALHPLSLEASSGTGVPIDIGAQRSCLKLELVVAAITATSLAVTIQHGPTASGPWEQLGLLPVLTAAVTRDAVPLLLNARRFIRASWALIGGGNATFSLDGEAHTLFATPSDLADGALPARASSSLDPNVTAKACLAATDEAATYLNGAFDAPIQSWGAALTLHVAKMARYHVMDRRGYQPGGPDELIAKGYDDAIKWLTMISLGKIRPPAIIDPTPTRNKNSARVTSRCPGRW